MVFGRRAPLPVPWTAATIKDRNSKGTLYKSKSKYLSLRQMRSTDRSTDRSA